MHIVFKRSIVENIKLFVLCTLFIRVRIIQIAHTDALFYLNQNDTYNNVYSQIIKFDTVTT